VLPGVGCWNLESDTTQLERWQRTIEVVEEDGRRPPMRLFTTAQRADGAGGTRDVPKCLPRALWCGDHDSSGVLGRMQVVGRASLWRVLQKDLRGSRPGALGESRPTAVGQSLVAPRSSISIHEKWFPQTAMSALLESTAGAEKRIGFMRALDRMVEHKEALEEHLAEDGKISLAPLSTVLLYDLTAPTLK